MPGAWPKHVAQSESEVTMIEADAPASGRLRAIGAKENFLPFERADCCLALAAEVELRSIREEARDDRSFSWNEIVSARATTRQHCDSSDQD
jgi:hypothetical protein